MAQRTILVLAVGGNVSQGILKALSHEDRQLRIIGADVSPLQMGLYTVDLACVSPWAHESTFLPWLIELCQRESVAAILSGAEPVLLALSHYQAQIEAETGARCIVSPHAVVALGDDKLLTCQWLEESGFNYPRYADCANADAVAKLVAETGFPLVAKPRHGGGARGLIQVDNPDDVTYVQRKKDYVLQEYLGTEKDEYTVGCFRDRDGLLAPSCCMWRELLSGTTYRAILGDFPDIRAEAERIVTALQPLGPCNVQLRNTPRGPVCFEINPRFSGTTPIRSHFGYNEVGAALDHILDGSPVQLPCVTEGVALRYWNELYAHPTMLSHLSAQGMAPKSDSSISLLEPYGFER